MAGFKLLRVFRFFYKDVLHLIREDCNFYDSQTKMVDGSIFQWEVYVCTICVWIVILHVICKGLKSANSALWFTVPAPMFLIGIMICRGLTLPYSSRGIEMFLKGTTYKLKG